MSKIFIKQILNKNKKLLKMKKLSTTTLNSLISAGETQYENIVKIIQNDEELLCYYVFRKKLRYFLELITNIDTFC